MPVAAWIGAIVTIALFVLAHIGLTIWWASRVNTLLEIVQAELKEIVDEFKASRSCYVSKEELGRDRALAEKENQAIWKRIDELKASQK